MKHRVSFEGAAFEEFIAWAEKEASIHQKIVALLRDIDRTPFTGLGKPEPLKYELQGYWSRRITQEHRLIYKVTQESIVVISCKYHYLKV